MNPQDIIYEALEWRALREQQDKQSWVERLFDFRDFYGKKYKRGADSSVILYLSERIATDRKLRLEAQKREDGARQKAFNCVKIYGKEALELFEKMWNEQSV